MIRFAPKASRFARGKKKRRAFHIFSVATPVLASSQENYTLEQDKGLHGEATYPYQLWDSACIQIHERKLVKCQHGQAAAVKSNGS